MAGLLDDYANFRAKMDSVINTELSTNIGDIVIDGICASAIAYVYDAYSPLEYKRRMTLDNEANYKRSVGDLTLTIESKISGNTSLTTGCGENKKPVRASGDLTADVEAGTGYDFWGSAFPRPYFEKGLDELLSNVDVASYLADIINGMS